MPVRVQETDFDLGAEAAALGSDGASGAVVTFTGHVRGDGVKAMTLEHYPGMTENALESFEAQARERWSLTGVTVIHRIGRLLPGERIMMVGVASRHRKEAFEAAEFLMDHLKTGAPFWKKEETEAGEAWVEATEADDEAVARWAGKGDCS